MTIDYYVGQRVIATRNILEGGDIELDQPKLFRQARYPEPDYIHARAGEYGNVVHVDEDGYPTVRFERTKTATVVNPDEIAPAGLADA